MSNERQKLLDYINKKNPKQCVGSMFGVTTFEDIASVFDGEYTIEQIANAFKAIMSQAQAYKANEIHVSPDVAVALIMANDSFAVIDYETGETEIDGIKVIIDHDATKIKFFK